MEERLREGGCVAAEDEAAELVAFARDEEHLEDLVVRRLAGEPLAWVVGRVTFCGIDVDVAPGVYVPRWQSEAVAEAGAAALPDRGTAVDLCCGSGAVAKVVQARRPGARVIATDIDERAVACARANGVAAVVGDLFGPLPADLRTTIDVVVSVAPYVPTRALPSLGRTPEPARALDGGADGLDVVRRIVDGSSVWLRRGGVLVVEIGGPQLEGITAVLDAAGFARVVVLSDPDGDVCGVVAAVREVV